MEMLLDSRQQNTTRRACISAGNNCLQCFFIISFDFWIPYDRFKKGVFEMMNKVLLLTSDF